MKWVGLLIASLCSIGSAQASVSDYVEMLKHSEQYWAGRKDKSSEFDSDPNLSAETLKRRSQLEQMLKLYAPKIWWHRHDPFGPTDPMEFLKKSSLWHKRNWANYQKMAPVTQVKAKDLKGNAEATQNFFLRFEDKSLGTGEERDWSRTKLGEKEYRTPIEQGKIPMLWKLGTSKVLSRIDPAKAPAERVLIEYWYHLTYSYATPYEVGNHQGDWEGFSILVDLSTDDEDQLKHELVSVYFAHHDNGSWHCPSELQWVDGHPEAFSALGTHATYHREGKFKSTFITDVTDRGRSWDTWQLLRPMANEPYYGYRGHWGDAKFLAFMSGPRVPDPVDKALPHHSSTNLPSRCVQ